MYNFIFVYLFTDSLGRACVGADLALSISIGLGPAVQSCAPVHALFRFQSALLPASGRG